MEVSKFPCRCSFFAWAGGGIMGIPVWSCCSEPVRARSHLSGCYGSGQMEGRLCSIVGFPWPPPPLSTTPTITPISSQDSVLSWAGHRDRITLFLKLALRYPTPPYDLTFPSLDLGFDLFSPSLIYAPHLLFPPASSRFP